MPAKSSLDKTAVGKTINLFLLRKQEKWNAEMH